MNLLSRIKVVPDIVPTAGAAAACTETEVDCTGFDRVLHIIVLGAAGAAGSTFDYKVQEAAATGMGGAADITSAALTQVTGAAGGSKCYAIDCKVNPAKPFQKAVAVVATNTFANGAISILYNQNGPVPSAPATEAVIV